MTSTNGSGKIGGYRREVDSQKLGPALLIASSLVLAIRTAKWTATHSDGLANVEWEKEVEDEAMHRDIYALNEELIAAGVRIFACACRRQATRSRCVRNPMAESSSPTGHTLRPRSTWADSRYWNALIWTRRWRGRARAPSPAGGRGRCERSSSGQRQRKPLSSIETAQFEAISCHENTPARRGTL